MRRDICHYYEKGLKDVFEAYNTTVSKKFGKDCKAEPFHTLSFGLSYSFKYNMNGGACTIHFMPYKTGTAVNIRYSIAQLLGARYEAHDRDMTDSVVSILDTPAQVLSIDVETFLLPENKKSKEESTAYNYTFKIDRTEQFVNEINYCPSCGNKLGIGFSFCPKCGFKIK